ncbi:MAG: bifunctional 5,10-methylenetetrahydrofolate dehydrogenase/5,10-methenyltetrahydrofolate cyclohydrolase [Methanomicrobiales archaeon]|nr:bifunctional 5,10-methylenetetrahydrofolate dehydrogenase/5,10-methenyltetrahydrofolate cyclohydrolase [Methanomicrobiales archaeon]MDD1662441.1 bifunctional 5,10-methylenetetrahydrofolate dehydrogenase/5,10-methenyltetrahydrofolate cyclohydrolase [Methanomicrobiales archaeon]
MILDGKATADRRLEKLKKEIQASGIAPRLATLIVGKDPGVQLYIRMKHRACERVGIGSLSMELPEEATTGEVVEEIRCLGEDPSIDGILVQLPLPRHVEQEKVIAAIPPEKDVDGFTPLSLGRLLSGDPLFSPCTPLGIMILLAEYGIPVEGTEAVVVGRSIEVGRPMAILLLNAGATVTVCHSKTRNLPRKTRSADLLVSAVGKAGVITGPMVKKGAVVIDVGISRVEGKTCGDVDFPAVEPIARAITPVPGGVGPMTIAMLMENTLKAARERGCRPAR